MPATESTDVAIVAHPPERHRVRSGAPAQAGQCCCCCCCCLHTVGGLIGAAVAPAFGGRRGERPRSQEADDYADDWDLGDSRGRPERSGLSAVALFWLSTLVLSLLILGVAGLLTVTGDTGAIWGGVAIIALGLPGVQLIAAIPPAIALGVSARPDKGYEFRQLGKILAGMIVGTMIGVGVMIGIGIILSTL